MRRLHRRLLTLCSAVSLCVGSCGLSGCMPLKFAFVLETPQGRETRHFRMELDTFNYNPLLHGPPN